MPLRVDTLHSLVKLNCQLLTSDLSVTLVPSKRQSPNRYSTTVILLSGRKEEKRETGRKEGGSLGTVSPLPHLEIVLTFVRTELTLCQNVLYSKNPSAERFPPAPGLMRSQGSGRTPWQILGHAMHMA